MPEIRRLTKEDLAELFSLRLHSLQEHPEAFGSSYEAEAARRLYQRNGFVTWGIDPEYLILDDGSSYDIEWMILSL